ncbi:hypothetical protein BT69DRAFT_1357290, partial [Atractiella rhizophila]
MWRKFYALAPKGSDMQRGNEQEKEELIQDGCVFEPTALPPYYQSQSEHRPTGYSRNGLSSPSPTMNTSATLSPSWSCPSPPPQLTRSPFSCQRPLQTQQRAPQAGHPFANSIQSIIPEDSEPSTPPRRMQRHERHIRERCPSPDSQWSTTPQDSQSQREWPTSPHNSEDMFSVMPAAFKHQLLLVVCRIMLSISPLALLQHGQQVRHRSPDSRSDSIWFNVPKNSEPSTPAPPMQQHEHARESCPCPGSQWSTAAQGPHSRRESPTSLPDLPPRGAVDMFNLASVNPTPQSLPALSPNPPQQRHERHARIRLPSPDSQWSTTAQDADSRREWPTSPPDFPPQGAVDTFNLTSDNPIPQSLPALSPTPPPQRHERHMRESRPSPGSQWSTDAQGADSRREWPTSPPDFPPRGAVDTFNLASVNPTPQSLPALSPNPPPQQHERHARKRLPSPDSQWSTTVQDADSRREWPTSPPDFPPRGAVDTFNLTSDNPIPQSLPALSPNLPPQRHERHMRESRPSPGSQWSTDAQGADSRREWPTSPPDFPPRGAVDTFNLASVNPTPQSLPALSPNPPPQRHERHARIRLPSPDSQWSTTAQDADSRREWPTSPPDFLPRGAVDTFNLASVNPIPQSLYPNRCQLCRQILLPSNMSGTREKGFLPPTPNEWPTSPPDFLPRGAVDTLNLASVNLTPQLLPALSPTPPPQRHERHAREYSPDSYSVTTAQLSQSQRPWRITPGDPQLPGAKDTKRGDQMMSLKRVRFQTPIESPKLPTTTGKGGIIQKEMAKVDTRRPDDRIWREAEDMSNFMPAELKRQSVPEVCHFTRSTPHLPVQQHEQQARRSLTSPHTWRNSLLPTAPQESHSQTPRPITPHDPQLQGASEMKRLDQMMASLNISTTGRGRFQTAIERPKLPITSGKGGFPSLGNQKGRMVKVDMRGHHDRGESLLLNPATSPLRSPPISTTGYNSASGSETPSSFQRLNNWKDYIASGNDSGQSGRPSQTALVTWLPNELLFQIFCLFSPTVSRVEDLNQEFITHICIFR